ncbi:hypothetical protein CTI14_65840, partial [Methylobacterium radiotolerans]
ATIMTDPDLADATYLEPLTPEFVEKIIEVEKPVARTLKALKNEGYRVVLVNSNPATIMTDPDLADATYLEPLTPEFVEKIIEVEKP